MSSVMLESTYIGSEYSIFSQNGGGGLSCQAPFILTSNKKGLMPSGSSGTLFKKQIVIEMDEVQSSSSSSIGREENANQAFIGNSGLQKLGNTSSMYTKNQFFNDGSQDKFPPRTSDGLQDNKFPQRTRLNFTGNPFSPEQTIFSGQSVQPQQQQEDSLIDFYSFEQVQNKQSLSQKMLLKPSGPKESNNDDDTLLIESKNFLQVGRFLFGVDKDYLQMLVEQKNVISIGPQSIQPPIQRQTIKVTPIKGPNYTIKAVTVLPSQEMTQARLDKKHKQLLQSQQQQAALQLNDDMLYRNNKGLFQKARISFMNVDSIERPQISPRIASKLGDQVIDLTNNKDLITNEVQSSVDKQQLLSSINIKRNPALSVYQTSTKGRTTSKSPSDQMLLNTRLLTSNQQKIMTQDLQGISQLTLLTPRRQHITKVKKPQQVVTLKNGKVASANIMSLKSQSQKIQLLSTKPVQIDEFINLAIEDDVSEEIEHSAERKGAPLFRFHVNHIKSKPISTAQQQKKHQSSPSISSKIPNSLAFRVKNHDDSDEADSGAAKLKLQDTTIQLKVNFEMDDALSTRRMGTVGDLVNFSLQNKEELNRINIPFTKLRNMDFSGIGANPFKGSSRFGFQQSGKVIRCASLIQNKQSLRNVVVFLDFENLLSLMSLNKKFREGYTSRPSRYQLEVSKIFKAQLRQLLIVGLSTFQRIKFWNFRTKFFYGKKKKPNLYRSLKRLKTNEMAAAEIRKDVHRTFPDFEFFQTSQRGQEKLFNVLNALAQKNVAMGYIQGMNFLAGTILLNLQRGEETFWMMMSILNKYNFDSILDLRKGGRFQVLCYQLEILMQNYLPALSHHLKTLKIPTDIYAANWFITMFCYELSLDLVFCILDVFLLEGIKSLLRISLALLKCMEKKLLGMQYDECMEYLSHCQKVLEIDSQTLLRTAYSFYITNRLLKDLEMFYNLKNNSKNSTSISAQQICYLKAFNRISLEEDDTCWESNSCKKYWVVLPASPEDMNEVIIMIKGKFAVSEEEILMFYQSYIKHKGLKEIVMQFTSTSSSTPLQVPFQQSESKASGLPKSRRKAHSTILNDHHDSDNTFKYHRHSINTIYELSNDEYSRGGYSTTKKNESSNKYSAIDSESPSKQIPSHIDYRSIQLYKSVVAEERTPVKEMKESVRNNESPFQKIGSRIKTIFGNFFKVQEKMNKSVEEVNLDNTSLNTLQDIDTKLTKSIYQSVVPHEEILIVDTFVDPYHHPSIKTEIFNAADTIQRPSKMPVTKELQKMSVITSYSIVSLKGQNKQVINESIKNNLNNHEEDYMDDDDENFQVNNEADEIMPFQRYSLKRGQVESPDFLAHKRRLFPDPPQKRRQLAFEEEVEDEDVYMNQIARPKTYLATNYKNNIFRPADDEDDCEVERLESLERDSVIAFDKTQGEAIGSQVRASGIGVVSSNVVVSRARYEGVRQFKKVK